MIYSVRFKVGGRSRCVDCKSIETARTVAYEVCEDPDVRDVGIWIGNKQVEKILP